TYPNGLSGGVQHVTTESYTSNVLMAETTAAGTMTITRDPVSLMPLTTTDAKGNVTTYTYQTYSGPGGTQISSGNVLTSTDALGNTTAYAYTALNQVWCTVHPAEYKNGVRCPSSAPSAPPAPGASDANLGATINFYNASDQHTATTDALGNTTTFSYTSGVTGVPNGLTYCTVDPANYQKS